MGQPHPESMEVLKDLQSGKTFNDLVIDPDLVGVPKSPKITCAQGPPPLYLTALDQGQYAEPETSSAVPPTAPSLDTNAQQYLTNSSNSVPEVVCGTALLARDLWRNPCTETTDSARVASDDALALSSNTQTFMASTPGDQSIPPAGGQEIDNLTAEESSAVIGPSQMAPPVDRLTFNKTSAPSTTEKPKRTPDGKLICPKCQQTFKSMLTLRLHNDSVHEMTRSWICEYPGCKRNDKPFNRNFSYSRHMLEQHGITVGFNATWKAEAGAIPQTAVKPSPGAKRSAEDNVDPLEAYLQTARLPQDTVKKKRKTDQASTLIPTLPGDPALMEAEINRLRKRETQLLEELRIERAKSASDLEAAERRRREQIQEIHRARQEDMNATPSNESVKERRQELKALRQELTAKHKKELEAAERRRQQNERRLWNLLTEEKPQIATFDSSHGQARNV